MSDESRSAPTTLAEVDTAVATLAPEHQQLFVCLAPYRGVYSRSEWRLYPSALEQQEATAALPLDGWLEMLKAAHAAGLLEIDAEQPQFLIITPVVSAWLEQQLDGRPDLRRDMECAYCATYSFTGRTFVRFVKVWWRPMGQAMMQTVAAREEVNFRYALDLALAHGWPFLEIYNALIMVTYRDKEKAERRALHDMVTHRLEELPVTAVNRHNVREIFEFLTGHARALRWEGNVAESVAFVERMLAFAAADRDHSDLYLDTQFEWFMRDLVQVLGELAVQQERWEEAEQRYTELLQLEGSYPGSQVTTYQALADIARAQAQWTKAEALLQAALRDLDAGAADDDSDLADDSDYKLDKAHKRKELLFRLGEVALAQGQCVEAEEYYRAALALLPTTDFMPEWDRAEIGRGLGAALRRRQRYAEARTTLVEALRDGAFNTPDEMVLATLLELAHLWRETGDDTLTADVAAVGNMTPAEIEEWFRQALAG